MIDLIGIHALIGVGKDSFANFLTDHTPCSFAEPLRRGLLKLNPYVLTKGGLKRLADIVEFGDWDFAKTHPEVRRLMQVYGTEAGRDIHGQDCWIKIAEKFVDDHEKVVIRDVRFENEINAIYAWEFSKPKLKNRTVLVKMLGESRREHEQVATKHASEQGLPDWMFDFIVMNNGTLDDLEWAANYIAKGRVPKRRTRLTCNSRTVEIECES